MKITKQFLRKLISEEVGPVKGQANSSQLQHMYPGQGNLRNFPTGEPPDNSTRDKAYTRPPYETLGVKVDFEGDDIFVTSGKTRYRVRFEDPETRTRVIVSPSDEYGANIDGERIDWDQNAPASVRFDPHLDKFIKELVSVEIGNQLSDIESDEEEVENED